MKCNIKVTFTIDQCITTKGVDLRNNSNDELKYCTSLSKLKLLFRNQISNGYEQDLWTHLFFLVIVKVIHLCFQHDADLIFHFQEKCTLEGVGPEKFFLSFFLPLLNMTETIWELLLLFFFFFVLLFVCTLL